MSTDDQTPTEATRVNAVPAIPADSDLTTPARPYIAPTEQLSLLSMIERLVLARWDGRDDPSGASPAESEGAYLEHLKFMQRALLFYAHWHISSFEELPTEQVLRNVSRHVTLPMDEGFEYLAHGMDTWAYRHEFFLLGLIGQETEPTVRRPKSVKLDYRPRAEAGPPKPAEKVKREPGPELRQGIAGIVIAHRVTWGGAPGGFIQGRAAQFDKRLCNYAAWFIDQNGREPSLFHLGKVARQMELSGYSSLAREFGEKEFRLVFTACKASAGHA